MARNMSSRTVGGGGLWLAGAAALVGGAALFYYGWKRKGTMRGRLTSAAGLSLLTKALRNPQIAEHLGPLQGLLDGPLAAMQKFLP